MFWGQLRANFTTSSPRVALVNVRFVVARTALSVAIACCIIVAFAVLNAMFAAEIAGLAYVIPAEILTAIVLGFCLGGLPDAAAALHLVNTSAREARVCGDRLAERDILIRALVCAERTRDPSLIATVRAHAAFSAWFAADDEEFQSHARVLCDIVGEKPMRGLRRFAKSTRGLVQDFSDLGELPEWTARTSLVACSDCDDPLCAKYHAVHAAAAADSSGDAFLQVVSLVALAEFDDEQRDRLYDKAVECSNAVAAPRLSEAVLALAARSPNAGTLDAFVNRRLRALRSSRPKLDVRFADGSVRVDGSPIKLRPRESALLFIIAENESGTSFNELSDRLWPDVDGDAARNALHVCLHRLRKALGDDTAIVRDASRYRLRDEAAVDLWQLRSILKRVAHDSILSDEERMHLCEAFEALHSGRRERPTEQQWFSGIERTIARLTCDVGWCLVEDALIRREFERAQFIATSRIDEQIASGDRAGALETYESYRDLMARLSLGEPPSSLQTLVAPLETNE